MIFVIFILQVSWIPRVSFIPRDLWVRYCMPRCGYGAGKPDLWVTHSKPYPDGPIKINVEAYVVKGMSTPLILGNNFADQYSISVICQEGSCTMDFRDSNWRMPVNNSVSPSFLDEDGCTFKLCVLNSSAKSTHQKDQRFKHKTKFREHDRNIWSAVKIIIPPETSVAVPVLANFPSGVILQNCFISMDRIFLYI